MKYIIFILLLISATSSAQLPKDKQDHLLVGTMIGFSASSMTVNQKPIISFAWSIGSTAVIGGSKELIYDKWMGNGTPEWKDFGWTMIGGVAGFGIVQGFKGIVTLIDKRQLRKLQVYDLK